MDISPAHQSTNNYVTHQNYLPETENESTFPSTMESFENSTQIDTINQNIETFLSEEYRTLLDSNQSEIANSKIDSTIIFR